MIGYDQCTIVNYPFPILNSPMSPYLVLFILVAYFAVLLTISYITSRGADTNTFFTAGKNSPWYLVAYSMIGTALSGVTFISVPGNVGNSQFSYFQFVLGNIVGYMVVAFVLMPLYYRLNLVSIYTYLEKRYGFWSYKMGALSFLVSRTMLIKLPGDRFSSRAIRYTLMITAEIRKVVWKASVHRMVLMPPLAV